MTKEQNDTILNFRVLLLRNGGKFSNESLETLHGALGFDFLQQPDRTLELLGNAATSGDADEVENVLGLVLIAKIQNDRVVPILMSLLELPWHHSHENIALELEWAADPRAVEVLYRAALMKLDYLSYDKNFALARKCAFALGRIGTPDALAKLRLLEQSENPVIVGHAREQLAVRKPRQH